MRILVMASRDLENPSLGGGEMVLSQFSKALLEKGHDVEYLCATFPAAPRETWIEGLHVRRLASETLLGPAAFFAYLGEYRGKVDLVLEDILGGSRIPFFAPLYVREPIISLWFQDHIPLFKNQYPAFLVPALTVLESLLVRVHRQTEVLTISSESMASLVRKGADPNKVRVYHPGISSEFLAGGATTPQASRREARLVVLGKIRRYKCAHHAIEALARLTRQVPSAKLSIVGRLGDRDYHRELIALSRQLGLENRVDFEIGISEGRKKELLGSSRALISPAPVEGFGMAVIEANACGLPVVGSEGIPKAALQEGVNGFRVPFGDSEAIAERARRLLTDDNLFNQISNQAVEFSHQFTWDKAVGPLMDLVENMP